MDEGLKTSGETATEKGTARTPTKDETANSGDVMSRPGIGTTTGLRQRLWRPGKILADATGAIETELEDVGQIETGTRAASQSASQSGWTSLSQRRGSRLIPRRTSSDGRRE